MLLHTQRKLRSLTLHQAGADGQLIATSLQNGERLLRYHAHHGPLNSIAVTISGGRELVLTGGDDGIARVFDPDREDKEPVVEFDDGQDVPVTAVAWSSDGNQCFVGGVDNAIKVWDLRKNEIVYTLRGHTDTVSSCLKDILADGTRFPPSPCPLLVTSSLLMVSTPQSSSTTYDPSPPIPCVSTERCMAHQQVSNRFFQNALGQSRTAALE
jgi:WD40 repeat protein